MPGDNKSELINSHVCHNPKLLPLRYEYVQPGLDIEPLQMAWHAQKGKFHVQLYCCAPEKDPQLVLDKTITKTYFNPEICVDEIRKKVLIIGENSKRNFTLTEIGAKWEKSGQMTVKNKFSVYTGPQSHPDDDLFEPIINPRDGSILRYKLLLGTREVRLQWLAKDQEARKIVLQSEAIGMSENGEFRVGRCWGEFQFCNNSQTFLACIAPIRKKFTYGKYGGFPAFAIFSLDYNTKTVIFTGSFHPGHVSPKIFGNHRLQTLLPVGNSYKYLHFIYSHVYNREFGALLSAKYKLMDAKLEISKINVLLPYQTEEFFVDIAMRFQKIFGTNRRQRLPVAIEEEKERVIGDYFGSVVRNDAQKKIQFVAVDLKQYNYKDYRYCAGCSKMEKRKRKNKDGRRIADFKVCRQCKILKLHLKWWYYPCHFCSTTCLNKHWNKHKKQHEQHVLEEIEGDTRNIVLLEKNTCTDDIFLDGMHKGKPRIIPIESCSYPAVTRPGIATFIKTFLNGNNANMA